MRQFVYIGVRLGEQHAAAEVRLRRETILAAEAAGLALEPVRPRQGGALGQVLLPFALRYRICTQRGEGVKVIAVQDLVTSLLRDAGVELVAVASLPASADAPGPCRGAPQALSLPCSWFRAERSIEGRVIYVWADRPLPAPAPLA